MIAKYCNTEHTKLKFKNIPKATPQNSVEHIGKKQFLNIMGTSYKTRLEAWKSNQWIWRNNL